MSNGTQHACVKWHPATLKFQHSNTNMYEASETGIGRLTQDYGSTAELFREERLVCSCVDFQNRVQKQNDRTEASIKLQALCADSDPTRNAHTFAYEIACGVCVMCHMLFLGWYWRIQFRMTGAATASSVHIFLLLLVGLAIGSSALY